MVIGILLVSLSWLFLMYTSCFGRLSGNAIRAFKGDRPVFHRLCLEVAGAPRRLRTMAKTVATAPKGYSGMSTDNPRWMLGKGGSLTADSRRTAHQLCSRADGATPPVTWGRSCPDSRFWMLLDVTRRTAGVVFVGLRSIVHLPHDLCKEFVHHAFTLSGGLHEGAAPLLGQGPAFVGGHFSLALQVHFVPNQDDWHLLIPVRGRTKHTHILRVSTKFNR